MEEQTPHTGQQTKRPYDKKVHGKRYPVTQKIAIKALQNSNMSVSQIAEIAHTTTKQVHRVWNDPELNDLTPRAVEATKKGLLGLFYKRSLQATLAIDSEKLAQASALQLATVAGIMTEKGRLMEGLSTENVSHRGVIENLDAERAKIMSRIQSLDTDGESKP